MYDHKLMASIFEAGLIQFGAFDRGGRWAPYLVRLETLASYPAVLRHAAVAVTDALGTQSVDRLVCAHDAVALGTVVSQHTNIPLVLHRGVNGEPISDFVGAYDIGHPAAFVSLTTDMTVGFVERLVSDAGRVGLQITQWVSLMRTATPTTIPHFAAFTLNDAVNYAVGQGELSAEMAERIASAAL